MHTTTMNSSELRDGKSSSLRMLDCTFRDGGYYNNWDFSADAIAEYLAAMAAIAVDYVELGFRSFEKTGFRGACAYTTDSFIRGLNIPAGVKVGVMVNAAEVVRHASTPVGAAQLLFGSAEHSPVTLIRFACHLHEFEATLPVCAYLKESGYQVGINLMQIADRSEEEVGRIGKVASQYPLDVLYFADSLGSLNPTQTAKIVRTLREYWHGAVGIHTHDNMGRAVANTLRAIDEGVTWIDSTVTGMGRGPGNAQTEYLALELSKRLGLPINIAPLLALIRRHFKPMQTRYGWGVNAYYYLAGQHGIHPTYVQEMLADPRYGEAEILSVIDHLREVGGKKFSMATLETGRLAYTGSPGGTWMPATLLEGKQVLIIGAGQGVVTHRKAIEQYVCKHKPFVIALNDQTYIDGSLIDARAACHPFRLLADCEKYRTLGQPLIVPLSKLPEYVQCALSSLKTLDFGLTIVPRCFAFDAKSATAPTSLAIAYALAVTTSGKAESILLAGFDGYSADDPRTIEMDQLLADYQATEGSLPLMAVTPTRYKIPSTSIYAI